MQHDDERPHPSEEPEAPVIPGDEPTPAPVQDPPAEPGRTPYVVREPRGGPGTKRESGHD